MADAKRASVTFAAETPALRKGSRTPSVSMNRYAGNPMPRRGSIEELTKDAWIPTEPTAKEKVEAVNRLEHVRNKIVVVSGKGGTGKSTVVVELAQALAATGAKVGIIDADINCPSIPRMLNITAEAVMHSKEGWVPVKANDLISVMSIEFLVPSEKREEAITWHESRKRDVVKQFVSNVNWGELDYLLIDTPSGASEIISALSLQINFSTPGSGALVIANPSDISVVRAAKDIDHLKKANFPLLGVVENKVPADADGKLVASLKEKQRFLQLLATINYDPSLEGGNKSDAVGEAFDKLAKALIK